MGINQKYKDDMIHGRVSDNAAGWEGHSVFYDNEMLWKEYDRKMLFRIPLLLAGLALFMVMVLVSYDNINMRLRGTCLKVNYMEKSSLMLREESKDNPVPHTTTTITEVKSHSDGYIFAWKNPEDGFVPLVKVTEKLTELGQVYLHTEYDYEMPGFDYSYIDKVGSAKGYTKMMLAQGIQPKAAYIFVYSDIPFFYELEKGSYVNLYFNEIEGETYFNLRVLPRWWIVLIVDIFVALWNYLVVRSLIKIRNEQKKLERQEVDKA